MVKGAFNLWFLSESIQTPTAQDLDAYLDGGETDARVFIDGNGDREEGLEIAGSTVVSRSRSSPQLLGLGDGGRLRRW